jgi:hypothetical protein
MLFRHWLGRVLAIQRMRKREPSEPQLCTFRATG